MSRSACLVRASRWYAPATFGDITRAIRSGVCSASTPSSSTPAACATPRNGHCAGIAPSTFSSACLSATSTAATVTFAPRLSRSETASLAPGVSNPRRPVSTRCFTPRLARLRATRSPSSPSPPVTSTVPSVRSSRACPWLTTGARSSRATRRAPERHAIRACLLISQLAEQLLQSRRAHFDVQKRASELRMLLHHGAPKSPYRCQGRLDAVCGCRRHRSRRHPPEPRGLGLFGQPLHHLEPLARDAQCLIRTLLTRPTPHADHVVCR